MNGLIKIILKKNSIKNILKFKDVYNCFKSSESFHNLNKIEKRLHNYKYFSKKLQTLVTNNKNKTKVINKYSKILCEI